MQYFKRLLIFTVFVTFMLQLEAQGTDNCGVSATLLAPTPGVQIEDDFTFSTALTPTATGTPNPYGFYYTVSADNEIFVNPATCADLWYRVQVPASGGFNLDVVYQGGGTSDLAMAVYTACNGTLIAAADDYISTTYYLEPTISVSCLTPGSIVYVRIWQYGCSGFNLPSNFKIYATDLADLNPGDVPTTAETIPTPLGSTTTAGAINDNYYPLMYPDLTTNTCTNAGYAIAGGCEDRWYKINVPANELLDIRLANASTTFTVQTFTGTPCNLTELKCGLDSVTANISDITFTTATDVYIRIFDKNCDEYGTYDLITTLKPRNNNDLICNAEVLNVGGAVETDTLINSTPSSGVPNASCGGVGTYCRDIWFQTTAAASGTMTISYNVTANIGVLPSGVYVTAYSGTCTGALSVIACKSGTTNDSLQYYQTAGQTSWIRVMDYNCDTAAHQVFTIKATQKVVPPNDEVCNSIAINNNDTTIASMINATQSATTPFPTCNYTTANVCEDIWYNYTFTQDGTFDLSMVCTADCASGNTSNIAIYTDSDADPCNGGFTQTGCYTSGSSTTSIPCLEGRTGDKYYFRIFDFDCNNNSRIVTMYSKFTPAVNSLPCNAYTLDNGQRTDTVETCGVTSSPIGTPDPVGCGFVSNDACEGVWFKTTIPNSGNITITINPDYFAATTNDIAAQAYVDVDNNPCNGGLTLQGACANGNNTFNLTYTGLTPGNQLYIRIWDFNCNSLTGEDFSISVTSNNDVALTAAVNGTTVSLACGESIHFTDDGGTGANYSNHAPRTVTFCVPGGKALMIEEVTLDIEPAKTSATCVQQNTGGNDVLTIIDGNTSGNIISNITGNQSAIGRFGTYVSNNGCMTFTFDADNSSVKGAGFDFILSCVDQVTPKTTTVAKGSTVNYSDPGGALNPYPNNAFEIQTFCPDAAALAAGEKIQAIMNNMELEAVVDKLYVFDGSSINAPLLGAFTGHQTFGLINQMGTLRATASNVSGCLTFMFVSDESVTDDGFNAVITTGIPIGANGGENCSSALDISNPGKYTANTFLATGDPRNTDPNLCVPNCIAGTGTQNITQFEGTIWYKFTTPAAGCTTGDLMTLQLTNFSTQITGAINASYPRGTSGTQMSLYQTNSCITNPANWEANKVTCYDILQNGDVTNITGLLPSTTYYMLFDNFAGRPAVLDIQVYRNDIDSAAYAGLDGDTLLCTNVSHLLDLDTLIRREDTTGIWVRVSGTGGTFDSIAHTFNTNGATTSVFNYIVKGNAPCPNDTSVATVNLTQFKSAGTDGNTSVCDNSTSIINLFSLISGGTTGGTWTRLTGTGGTFNASGAFTPAVGATNSTFQYVVANSTPCINDTSLVTINISYTTTSTTTVSVCNNQLPYVWNGTNYIAAGTYAKHFTNNAGCDSTATLVLTVNDTTTSTTPVTVCNNQLPYVWNGTSYSASGTYTKHFTNNAGCDSTATLVLTIKVTTTSTTTVSVCNNQLPYVWNGTNYIAAGTYAKYFTNNAGCDSTATLVLTVNDTTTSTTRVSVCNNQLPYVWNGTNYSASGTYTKHFTNNAGCDSTANLVLTINDTTTSTTAVTVCNNQLPYVWNGTSYSASGTYTKHFTNNAGCDSTANLVLTINDTTTSTTVVTVCNNQLPYVWNGTSYSASGTYTKHFTNNAGCDSTATLVLTVNDTTTSTTPVSVCNNQLPYVWNGTNYSASGTYTKHFTNNAGCDSTANLVLTINDTTTSTTSVTVCNNQLPYVWNGTSYSASGTYTKHFTNNAGCDSTATLVLTVNDTTINTTSVSVCNNQLPYVWNGTNYSASGIYTKHFTNNAGCDSTANLVLTVNDTTTSTTAVTVCNNQLPYVWNGTNYSALGTYTKHFTNNAGCDSTANLVLTVNDTTTSTTAVTVCNNQLPYVWNGTNYSASGTYTKHFTNNAGCDSTATLVLTVNDTTTSTTPVTVCNNQLPYVWNGTSYSASGTYTKHFINNAGCDSTATLVLTVNDTTINTTSVSVCNNQLPYVWNGTNYSASGTYTKHFTNNAGCDSTATLVLTVNDTTINTTSVSVCNNQLPYVWNGTSYSASGTYTKHFTNNAGCDSTANLVLTINDTTTSTTPVTVCNNQLPYVWNGTNYSTSGTYTKHFTNNAGCDSTANLVLTVNDTTTSTTPVTVCNNQLPYVWNGTSYSASGTYTKHFTNNEGCDSTANLVLTVNDTTTSTTPVTVCNNQLPYVWNGTSYSASGTYTKHFTNNAGCDSTANLVLTVNDTTTSTTVVTVCNNQLPYVWNGTNYSTSGTYTKHFTNNAGCDSTANLVLTVNDTTTSTTAVTVCNNQLPYVWNGTNYSTSGTYTKHFTNNAGCDSTATLVLTVNSIITNTINKYSCKIADTGRIINTYLASGGCDSVVTIITTLSTTCMTTDTIYDTLHTNDSIIVCVPLDTLFPKTINGVTISPMECFTNGLTPTQIDAQAAGNGATTAFATWKGAYDYAVANNRDTITFIKGTYYPGGQNGLSSDWGDASGGFPLLTNMKVFGNGSVIDNSANNNFIAFTTMAGNNTILDGLTFVGYTATGAGAVKVDANVQNWTISNCSFDHCDWHGDAVQVSLGSEGTGNIINCNFYNNTSSGGVSALYITGAALPNTNDLNIRGTSFSCNMRNTAGGAIQILSGAHIDFSSCLFAGNEASSANGGAISIQGASVVTVDNSIFRSNHAAVNVQDDGGAIDLIEGSSLTITNSIFKNNYAQDKGGAIAAAGGSASFVTLNISNTVFDSNRVSTATSYGGAIYLNDVYTSITNNYFLNNKSLGANSNGGGGAICAEVGNGSSDFYIDQNSFSGNVASNSKGNDILAYSDVLMSDAVSVINSTATPKVGVDICGSNEMQYIASPLGTVSNCFIDKFNRATSTSLTNGWTETETAADGIQIVSEEVDFDGGSGYEWLYRNLVPSFVPDGASFNPVLANNTSKLTWSFNFGMNQSTSGFASGEKGLGVILASTNSDYTLGNGYAVIVGETSASDQLRLVKFTGGLDNNSWTNILNDNVDHGIDAGNRISVKVEYDPSSDTWTMYAGSASGTNWYLDDPRQLSASQNQYSGSAVDASYTGSSMTTFGVVHNDATSTAQISKFDSYAFRMGDERDGKAWTGTYSPVTASYSCPTTTRVSTACTNIVYTFCDGSKVDTGVLGIYAIDSLGCVKYISKDSIGTEQPICVVACDTANDICDTTYIVITVLPTIDTLRDTNIIGSDTIICVPLEPGFVVATATVFSCGHSNNSGNIYSVNNNGCISIHRSDSVGYNLDTLCISVCNATGICDTTIVIISNTCPAVDTIPLDTSICAGDSVTINGIVFRATGTYYVSDGALCPTYTELNLTVMPLVRDTVYNTSCAVLALGTFIDTIAGTGTDCDHIRVTIVTFGSCLDTLRDTNQIGTTTTVCVPLETGFTPSTGTLINCGHSNNSGNVYTVDNNGCVTVVRSNVVGYNLDTICVVVCDAANNCDTTVIIFSNTPKKDTIRDTICIGCTVDTCINVEQGMTITSATILNCAGTPSHTTTTVTILGSCVNVSTTGVTIGTDTVCIVACDANTGICDTTVIITTVPPNTDTLRDTNQIGTTTTVCVPLETGFTPSTGTLINCGHSNNSGNVYTVDNNGCVTVVRSNVVGYNLDTICVVVCDAANNCDTTVIIFSNTPKQDTIRDTICIGCTVDTCINVEQGMTITTATILNCAGTPSHTTTTVTILGSCVNVSTTGVSIGTDTVCIVACDANTGICDTTVIITTVPPNTDTLRDTNQIGTTTTVCVPLETGFTPSTGTLINCGHSNNSGNVYTVDNNGCVTVVRSNVVGYNLDTICVVVCDAANNCDTTVIIFSNTPKKDTIRDTICIGCTVDTCINVEQGMTITTATILNCAGTPSHTTTTVTILGSCVNVSTTGVSIGTDTVCIVACDANTGICDTTVIITTVPPNTDTLRDTNLIGTTTTVCVPLETGFTPSTGTLINCGHSNNSGNVYTVDNNGCVTVVRSNVVGYNLDTICVVVCDAANNCDTTVIIFSNTPKQDTIRDTICIGCTVDTCINVEQGMTITTATILNCAGTPSHTTTTVTILGSCVNVSTTGVSIGTDTVCIVACDANTGICDTTVIITTVPPNTDTLRDTNQIGTTTTVCVPLETGFTPSTGTLINCGHSNNSGNVYTVDNNGCVTVVRSNVVGYNLDTICVVVCDAANNCDTTVIIFSNTPKKDTIRDTICIGCTVDTCINVEQGMTITSATILNCAGTPSHTTTTVTILGSCVNVSTTGVTIGTDTVCIVACDANTGICDTTVIITTVPPNTDTLRDTNQIGTTTTVCVPLETGFTPSTGTLINCGHSNNSGNVYTVDNNGCVTVVRSNVVGYNLDTICVVVCDAANNCDTTVIIFSNTPKQDTIRDTICIGCTVDTCINVEQGMTITTATILNCAGTPSHTTTTVTILGSCVNVSTTGVSIGTDTVCIVACDANTGICDTTVIITTVPPNTDTLRDTNQIGTTTTVCVPLETGFTPSTGTLINCGHSNNSGNVYTVDNNGCVTVTRSNVVGYNLDTICVVVCDAANNCDTTVIIFSNTPKQDTIRDTICIGCTVDTCINVEQGMTITTATILNCAGTPSHTTTTVTILGSCVNVSTTGVSIGTDTVCIVACDANTGICDTTVIITTVPPNTDTLRDTNQIGTTTTVCVPLETGFTPSTGTLINCGHSNNSGNVYTVDNNGCVTVTRSNVVGYNLDTICVVVCDAANNCDTTVIIFSNTPKQDTIRDTICIGCTVDTCINVEQGMTITTATILNCAGTPSHTTTTVTILGSCVNVSTTGVSIGTDTVCIVACDANTGICDTTVIITTVPPNTDTLRDTNQIGTTTTVCVPLETGFTPSTGTLINCGHNNNSGNVYTVDNNGCVTVVRSNVVGYNLDTICVVVCDAANNCDTTVIIFSNTPKQDTIRDTICIGCTVDTCINVEQGMTITTATILNCAGTPSHTTTTVTILGSCVNVSTTGVSIGTDTVCIVACDANTGICDTTVIITTVPPNTDTLRDTNQIGTTTTVCVPLETGFTPNTGTLINCGHSNNSGNEYTVDNNGCVTVVRSNVVGYNLDTICVVVCDAANNCDTTVIIFSNTPKQDTIRDTICIGCTVDTCINVEQGMTITTATILNCAGTPSHTTTTVTILGSCVNVSTTGVSIGTDTVCIVACDANTGICDTTVIITTVPPNTDTLRDTNQIGTTTTVCVPLETGFTPSTGTLINCGHSNNSGNVYTVDNNGCVTVTRSNVVGYNLDTICVVVCDAANNCDTTVIIFSNTPKKDTIRDTICIGCTVDTCINVEQGMTITTATILNCAGTPSHTTTTVTILGSCVNVSTTGVTIGTDTVCIVACDANTGICDTTVIITKVVCPQQDTIILDTALCEGQSILINGNSYSQTGTYFSSNNDTCPTMTELHLIVHRVFNLVVNLTTCDATQAGTTVDTFMSSSGCDSIVTTITTLLSTSRTTVNTTTCNPDLAGTFIDTLQAANGCDSIITTITTLVPEINVTLSLTTCDATQAGTIIDTFMSSSGCDSIVTTITTLLPISRTTVNTTTCNPDLAGTSIDTLEAANGCDSIITTITTLVPEINVTLSLTTCDATQAGTTVDTFMSSSGCDSIVTTITTLLPTSRTTVNTTTCNPDLAGTSIDTLEAANGCDSIITTITTLVPEINVTLNLTTCDAIQAGTIVDTFMSSSGCDSIVTTITTLLPTSRTTVNTTTCNPDLAGTSIDTLEAANGCDSIITTITTLVPEINVTLNLTTCDAIQAGTIVDTFMSSSGCDSIVTTITTLLPTSRTTVNTTTCNPDLAGTSIDTLEAANGCDSIITTITIYQSCFTIDTLRDTNLINSTTTVCAPLESGFNPAQATLINCGHTNHSGNSYTVDNNGCITIVRSSTVGYNLDTLCVVVCNAQEICDTTIMIFSNTRVCPDLIRDTTIACTTPLGGGLCIPLTLDNILQYHIFVDGSREAIALSSSSGCGQGIVSSGYNFSLVNYVDNVPHLLEEFGINATTTLNPNINFNTLTELVAYMNSVNAAGAWYVDGLNIRPANPDAAYAQGSGITFFSLQPEVATYSVQYNSKTTYSGSLLPLSIGCHQVLLVDTISGCRDSAQICITGGCGITKDTIWDTLPIRDTITICPKVPTGTDITVTACDGSTSGQGDLGTWSINAQGCLVYIAGPLKGNDTLCVKACSDLSGECIETTIIITVTGYPPIAINDTTVTDPNTPIDIPVLTNDIQTDEDPLALCGITTGDVIVTNPLHGTVTINGGIITYTPAHDYKGLDSFQYQICDPEGRDTAWVFITITDCVIPNGITPNGDGYNDYFVVPCITGMEHVLFCVYNRWGIEVYKNMQYDNTFDGKYQGEDLPDGTYYYVLEYVDQNGNKVKKASFLVIHRAKK